MKPEFLITNYNIIPNSDLLQTEKIQSVLNMCKESGGTVIFPAGNYVVGSLRLWSDTTLILKDGAHIIGSANIDDYIVFDVDEDIQYFTDGELIPVHDNRQARKEYRHAVISVFAQKNIVIKGEGDCSIDGVDCFDPLGEEGFRGPHAIFLSSCKNIEFNGYKVVNAANFAHQLDNCENIRFQKVNAQAGHDGVHLNQCKNIIIEDCMFETGDDCIAGINITNLFVNNCYLNTSCNAFRIGGANLSINKCEVKGFGKYAHRLSLHKGNGAFAPENMGRHNTLYFMEFFASPIVIFENGCNVSISDCKIDNVGSFLHYESSNLFALHVGAYLTNLNIKNTVVTNLKAPSVIQANSEHKLNVIIQNCQSSDCVGNDISLFDGKDENTIVL